MGERGRWNDDEVQDAGVVGGRWMEKFFDPRASKKRAEGGEYVHHEESMWSRRRWRWISQGGIVAERS